MEISLSLKNPEGCKSYGALLVVRSMITLIKIRILHLPYCRMSDKILVIQIVMSIILVFSLITRSLSIHLFTLCSFLATWNSLGCCPIDVTCEPFGLGFSSFSTDGSLHDKQWVILISFLPSRRCGYNVSDLTWCLWFLTDSLWHVWAKWPDFYMSNMSIALITWHLFVYVAP